MSFIKKGLLAVTALTLSASGAFALTQTSSVNFGPTATDFTTGTLTLPAFVAPAGGATLNSATVTLAASINTSGTATNKSTTNQSEQVSLKSTIFLNSSNGPVGSLSTDVATGTVNFLNVAPGDSRSFGPFNPSNSATTGAITSGLAAFSSPVNFTAQTLTGQTILGGGGNFNNTFTTTAQGIVTIAYDFTPTPPPPPTGTPEPASMALLGAGLAGLGLMRRRK